jgi:hypothetical protein
MMAEPIPPYDAEETKLVGRRGSARLRLAIPARLVSIYSTQNCILLDISRTGARLALYDPLPGNQSGYIEISGFAVFGSIVRAERGRDGGVNAMMFDEPIAKAHVLEIRKFAEDLEQLRRQALREQARRWVAGEK